MPRCEAKTIQRELEQGRIWPVYWLYGQERMKSRELLKRIRRAVFGEGTPSLGLAEEVFDGNEHTAEVVLESAQSLPLGGGVKLIIVREAHAIKDAEVLAPLLGPSGTRNELSSVCVFLAKDLDGRKKFSKALVEKAAVVSCEDVAEGEREAWIQYLAKRRGFTEALSPELVLQLSTLDPWSLDIVDQELEKFSLLSSADAVRGGAAGGGGVTDTSAGAFMEGFFMRNLNESLQRVEGFAGRPDEALPLLGLLAWNVRHLSLMLVPGTGITGVNPYVAERLKRWSKQWSLSEVTELQSEVAALDFQMKQTPLLPLGLWSSLVMRFCR